ncbi:MFS transporter [Nitrospirillum sp. BR 11163]|uniref:MFS transporter n=1 Tax=Nitrospirillum sp. BR 11163 TaxID=3104323 RepID=UPI002AFE3741|nr:MFS transporter [Nitrospirillum sp. BR 11163]MEA1672720.1 MFS transporter [Nitrospirillum sp. BR 11163]
MAALFAAAVLAYTDRQVLSLLVDPIRHDLGIGDTQMGLLQGLAFAAIYSLAGLPLGRLADMASRRWIIIVGVLIWSVATFLSGYAQSFGALFAARVCVGIGEAALTPAATAMIADYFPPQRRGAAIGFFNMGMALGAGGAIAIGGALLQAANAGRFAGVPGLAGVAPWRAVLLTLGLPGLAVMALLLVTKDPPRRGRVPTGGRILPLRDVLSLFAKRRATLLPLYLGLALISVADFAVLSWTPALLSRRFALSPGEIGVALGAITLFTGTVGTFGGGLFSDRLARRGGARARLTLAVGTSAVCVVGAGLAAVDSAAAILVLAAVVLFAGTVSASVGITSVQDLVTSDMRGLAAAIVSFGNILIGLGVGAMLTAALTDHLFHDPLAVGGSLALVVTPAAVLAAFGFWRAAAAVPR